ncbi:hypothetical protein ERJ75_001299700 [Trypanosoma vivax]|nr:hypothetical protein ERJ75_001299700 [Trypanosoma vivax]
MEHSGPYGLGAGGDHRPPEHQPEEGAWPEREVQKGVGRGAGQCTGHRVTVDSGACQRGTWSTRNHMVWERVGGQEAPEHQPEEGARPEREVQEGVGKGWDSARAIASRRQWSVPTWHMEHSGPYGLGAGGAPTGHQNTNLKKAHGRSEKWKREWGRGAEQCTGHRVTVDGGACQRGTWTTRDHMVWERVGGQRPPNTNLKKAHGRSEKCKGSGAGVRDSARAIASRKTVERANVAHGALRTIWSGGGWGADRHRNTNLKKAHGRSESARGIGEGVRNSARANASR